MKIKIITVIGVLILMILFGVVGCFFITQTKSGNEQDPAFKVKKIGEINYTDIYLMTDSEKDKQYFILNKKNWYGGVVIIERDQNDLQLER